MKKSIAIHIPGGIGDMIVVLPVIEALRMRVREDEAFVFYANYPELFSHFLPWAKDVRSRFKFMEDVGQLHWWLELVDVPIFRIRPGARAMPLSMLPLYETYKHNLQKWGYLIAGHPGTMNLLARQAVNLSFNRRTLLPHLLGLEVKPFEYQCQQVDRVPFITVHDGFDVNGQAPAESATKNWALEHWTEFIAMFKNDFPRLEIIQLGSLHSRKIPGADHSRLGKIPFTESLRYLKASIAHIDGDSGLVHARHLFKKPSVVLFGPTDAEYFSYSENYNIVSPLCSPCWWMKITWLTQCHLGAEKPICMGSIRPEVVRVGVREVINENESLRNSWG